jgi:hypothetical protein
MSYKDGREYDLNELRAVRTKDPTLKRIVGEAGQNIAKESGRVRSMREALIREHRAGRTENVKEIHRDIMKRSDY